jgi:hypothetical protein
MTNSIKYSGSPSLSVAEFLTMAMKTSGKTDAELAEQLELEDVREVDQLRDGSMRMSLMEIDLYVVAFAVDPTYLLLLALSEYFPEALEALMILGGGLVTANERYMLQDVREALGYRDLPLELIHGNAPERCFFSGLVRAHRTKQPGRTRPVGFTVGYRGTRTAWAHAVARLVRPSSHALAPASSP